ncbi:MAG: orotidine-5'-phosphate decarboxylase [Bacteroidetes bacterium 4572_77]|nr:MAG: orotidine-5'-phosphate decarboxylase [Bacteroidetes bacterium 4572_77]
MTKKQLFQLILKKKSFLCIGLDTDLKLIPKHLLSTQDPVFEFNKQIIDATHHLAVAYKPNVAFYESIGSKGWESLEKTIAYLNTFGEDIFTIADAKRGDIGNTSKKYAEAFFVNMGFDSLTIAPYMGEDSIAPFLNYPNKWAIILALTSNQGAFDFQYQESVYEKNRLFETVLNTVRKWGTEDNLMFVVGATKAEMLKPIRDIVPHHFLLVPGVGAQGGSLKEVAEFGMNKQVGLLVNSSRGIIYAGSEEDFAQKAQIEAQKLQKEMELLLSEKWSLQ